jgi:hypothetical protein
LADLRRTYADLLEELRPYDFAPVNLYDTIGERRSRKK